MFEMEPVPQLVSFRTRCNTVVFTVTKTSCRVLVCMYLKEKCLEQLSRQEREIFYRITDIIKTMKM